jgi:hypothetical protein
MAYRSIRQTWANGCKSVFRQQLVNSKPFDQLLPRLHSHLDRVRKYLENRSHGLGDRDYALASYAFAWIWSEPGMAERRV